MSDFKAKMHQIRFPLGLCPKPNCGAYSAPPDPLAVFKGPNSKVTDGGREGEGKGRRVAPSLQLGSLDPPMVSSRKSRRPDSLTSPTFSAQNLVRYLVISRF